MRRWKINMNILFIINLFVVIPLMVVGLVFLTGEVIIDIIEKVNKND